MRSCANPQRREFSLRNLPRVLAFGALLLLSTLPIVDWMPEASWHDQQRVGQVAIMLAMVTVSLTHFRSWPSPLLSIGVQRLVALVVAAGIVSALLAHQPLWGLVEVALLVGGLGLAWTVAVCRHRVGSLVDRVLFATLCFTCASLACQFVARYVAAVSDTTGRLDAWLLLDGFSNPRFYGQFLTLSIPLLIAPAMMKGDLRRYAWLAAALLACMWAIAITSGTRGTWLGLACAAAMLSCTGSAGRRWSLLQSLAALVGILIFWMAMTGIPHVLGMDVGNHAALRLTASLSKREVIWAQAVEAAVNSPLLGIGPMHLAELPNGVAAHPHQAILQWAAEWGIPSAVLVASLLSYGAWTVFVVLRGRSRSMKEEDIWRLCVAGALGASLAQGMVDGVLVMPYSQLWLALIGGWLFALHPAKTVSRPLPLARPPIVWMGAVALSVALLALVVMRDYPHLHQREEAFAKTLGGHYQPRFWAQGVIKTEKGLD